MSRDTDIIDYRELVEQAIRPQGDAIKGGAWAKEYAEGVAPIAWALVGVAEEINAGTTELADALGGLDVSDLGSAVERGIDSAGQEIAQAIERGLSEIARAVADRD